MTEADNDEQVVKDIVNRISEINADGINMVSERLGDAENARKPRPIRVKVDNRKPVILHVKKMLKASNEFTLNVILAQP